MAPAWAFYRLTSRPGLPMPNQSAVLRNLVTSRASDLLQRFHAERCSRLDESLMKEDWKPSTHGLWEPLQTTLDHVAKHHKVCSCFHFLFPAKRLLLFSCTKC